MSYDLLLLLCAINLRLVLITSGFEFGGACGALIDIICCIPRATDVEDDRGKRLLGDDEGVEEGGDGEEEQMIRSARATYPRRFQRR